MFNPNDAAWDAKLDTFAPGLPDGEHVVFIADASTGHSKGGTPYVELEFACHDPASPSRGKSLRFQKFWTTDKALARLVRLCRAAGVAKAFDVEDEAMVQDALLDRMLRIKVTTKVEEYKGQSQSKTEAGFFDPLRSTDRQRLVAEYGETMLPPLDEPGAPPAEQADPFSDDEIPF